MTISSDSPFDLVIRGGLILDGSGSPGVVGDVAVKDGRIAAVGAVDGAGAEEIDAAGRIVTPGFVDIHTHYDGQAIWSKELSPSSAHGVTTVVLGNCGVGFAPCREADHELLIDMMEGVEDIPGVVMADGLPWNWETFPEYLDALDAGERDIDVAAFVPHSPLRVYAMGERGARRDEATPDDLARMRELVSEAIDAGAIGVASSRLNIHRTASGDKIPSFQAPVDEIVAIASGMTDRGKGTLQMVLDTPAETWADEVDRIVEITERIQRPATFTLAAMNYGPPVYREALERLTAANDKGLELTGQVLPRPVGILSGLNLTINPFVLCPSYKEVADLPLEEKVKRLKDPELRARLLSEEPDEGHPLAQMGRAWSWMFPMGETPNYLPSRDESIAARAQRAGVEPKEMAYDLMLERDGNQIFYGALGNYYYGKLDAAREMLDHPNTVLGLGDGGAHYGTICDASFPTFFLTQWARDGEMPIERAIHLLTAKPARALGFDDRGRIAVGAKADLNVIDLDGLALHSPYMVNDLPAGGKRLTQDATGYEATIVSGKLIRRFDRATGAYPGKLVRGPQAMAAA